MHNLFLGCRICPAEIDQCDRKDAFLTVARWRVNPFPVERGARRPSWDRDRGRPEGWGRAAARPYKSIVHSPYLKCLRRLAQSRSLSKVVECQGEILIKAGKREWGGLGYRENWGRRIGITHQEFKTKTFDVGHHRAQWLCVSCPAG